MSHKPLLGPGLHDIAESELSSVFSASFGDSVTRAYLVDGLQQYIAALKGIGIRFELWIDGSFVTYKVDPGDVDLVVFASESEIDSLPQSSQQRLCELVDRRSMRSAVGCDVLFCHRENQNLRSYWRGWYGFDRNESPKGIARVEISP